MSEAKPSESRQIANDLNDMISDWLRKSGHVTDVPHAVVMETRGGPIHLEMRSRSGRGVTIEIPREQAVEARTAAAMGREVKALIDAATRGIAELSQQSFAGTSKAVESPPVAPTTSDRSPVQKQVVTEIDRLGAAKERRVAQTQRT
jgi:hypothetical protein